MAYKISSTQLAGKTYNLESSPENLKKKEGKHTDAAVLIYCVMNRLLYHNKQ